MNDLKIGLIGGTGLGEAILRDHPGHRHDITTPFGKPSDPIIETQWDGVTLLLLARHGPGHTLNPSQIPSRANLFALKSLGVTHILATGAVGSLRDELRPRDLVIVDQLIDKTFKRDMTFFDKAAVHVDFAEPFCPVLRQILLEAAKPSAPPMTVEPTTQQSTAPQGELAPPGQPVPSESTPAPQSTTPAPQTPNPIPPYNVHDRGCYVCMEGPAFSTRAESLMHRLLGGDLIGMTALPEARLAREAEIPYAMLALVTDYDCWKPHKKPGDPADLLQEIRGNLKTAADNAVDLIQRTVRLMKDRHEQLTTCPARDALKLAIWSDKSKIDPNEIQRLATIWGRYFETPSPEQPNEN